MSNKTDEYSIDYTKQHTAPLGVGVVYPNRDGGACHDRGAPTTFFLILYPSLEELCIKIRHTKNGFGENKMSHHTR